MFRTRHCRSSAFGFSPRPDPDRDDITSQSTGGCLPVVERARGDVNDGQSSLWRRPRWRAAVRQGRPLLLRPTSARQYRSERTPETRANIVLNVRLNARRQHARAPVRRPCTRRAVIIEVRSVLPNESYARPRGTLPKPSEKFNAPCLDRRRRVHRAMKPPGTSLSAYVVVVAATVTLVQRSAHGECRTEGRPPCVSVRNFTATFVARRSALRERLGQFPIVFQSRDSHRRTGRATSSRKNTSNGEYTNATIRLFEIQTSVHYSVFETFVSFFGFRFGGKQAGPIRVR